MIEILSRREIEVLRLVAAGCRNYEIALCLAISIKTVEFHLSNIRDKLSARSRTDAVVRAVQAGVLDLTTPEQSPPEDGND